MKYNYIMSLHVHSIFDSISGEVGMFQQGSRCTFIRLQGCNVQCSYCDTEYAQEKIQHPTQLTSIKNILQQIAEIDNKQILITGGEPLLQKDNLKILVEELHANGYHTQIETNGTIVPDFYAMCWMVDYKLSGSGITPKEKFSWRNLIPFLSHSDYLKFVCGSMKDFDEAFLVISAIKENYHSALLPKFALSAVSSKLNPARLLEWMKKEPGMKDVLLNVQIHKYIGLKEDAPGAKFPNKIKDL